MFSPESAGLLESLGRFVTNRGARRSEREDPSQTRALGISRSRLQMAQRIAHLGHWELDPTTRQMTWSDEVYRIMGLEIGSVEPTGKHYHRAIHDDDRKAVHRAMWAAIEDGHPYQIRHRIVRPDGEIRVVDEVGEVSYSDEGTALLMLGTVHDVTDEVVAQRELAESESRFRTMFDASPHGLALVTGGCEIRTANLSFYKIVGTQEAQARSLDVLDLVDACERDELRVMVASNLAGLEMDDRGLTLRIRRMDDGRERVVQADTAPYLVNGRIDGVLVELRDITERMETRRQLELSEERLSLAQEIAHFGHWDWDLETDELTWSDEVYRIIGLVPQELRATPELFMQSVHSADRAEVQAALVATARAGAPYELRYRVVRPDGVVRHVDQAGRVMRDEDGVARRVMGTVHDVTDQVIAHQALAESEARLSRAQTNTRTAGWEYELSTGEIRSSGALARMFEVQAPGTELTLEAVVGAMHRDDRQHFRDAIHAGQHDSGRFETRFRFTGQDGAERVFWAQGELFRSDNGVPVRWVGTVQGITQLADAQQALAETTRRLELAQSQASIGSYGRNLETNEAYWSDELYRLLGYEPGEIEPTIANMFRLMHPDDRAGFGAAVSGAQREDGRYNQRNRFVRADGVERVFWQYGELTRAKDGTALRWDGTCQDVTELVAAQNALAESESRIKMVFDSVGTGLAIIGPDRRALIANQACQDILGYAAEDLGREPVDRLIHPDDLEVTLDQFQRRLEGEAQPENDGGTRLIHADGRVIETDLRAAAFRVGGEVIGVMVEFRDVTAELSLQRRLAESAEQIDTILEATPDAVIVADDDDVILRANAATEQVFGWTPEELVGKPVAVLVGGMDHAMHATYVDHYKETGEASTADGLVVGNFRAVTGRRSDGSDFPAELAVAETGLSDGRRLFVAAIRDISERTATERQLRRLNAEVESRSQETQALVQQLLTVQEEERRTVAYEIHDGPAQQLAAAQMFLEAFVHEAGITPSSSPHLAKAKRYLEEGLTETRRIMSGMRPALLDDLGLGDALSQLLVELTARAEVRLEFDASGLQAELPPAVEITLYRIAQEAAGNALKHSGTACLEVWLASNADQVRLDVQDHGAGFDTSAVRSPSEGHRFGLVGMRERVTLLGGVFDVESALGEGTRVYATIPLDGGN